MKKMRKSQEEIDFVSAMLIPVIAFLLLLIILYVNLMPFLDVMKFVLLFAHDIASLTETAYATPGDVSFVYRGPVPCQADYTKQILNCTKGNSWIAISFGREDQTYEVYHDRYVLDIRDEIFEDRMTSAYVNIPFYGRSQSFTGVTDISERTLSYPTEPSVSDYFINNLIFSVPVMKLGGVEIIKQQKNFFHTIIPSPVDTNTVGDLMYEIISFCQSNSQRKSFDFVYLPGFRPQAYRDVHGDLFRVGEHGTSDGEIFCITKHSGELWLDYECYDFNKISDLCNVKLLISMNYCNSFVGDNICEYDPSGETKSFLGDIVYHIGPYVQRINMTRNEDTIELESNFVGLGEDLSES